MSVLCQGTKKKSCAENRDQEEEKSLKKSIPRLLLPKEATFPSFFHQASPHGGKRRNWRLRVGCWKNFHCRSEREGRLGTRK